MRAEHADVLERIGNGEWDDDIIETVHDAVEEFANDFGADLDDDGVAVERDEPEAPADEAPAEEEEMEAAPA
jgi:hypothetical protein